MPANKTNVRVVIAPAGGEFRVQPAVAVLEKGSAAAQNDRLKIHNATSEEALVYFKDAVALFGAGTPVTEVIPPHQSITRQLDNTAVPNPYSYSVLMLGSGKTAKGNSDPQIIVEN